MNTPETVALLKLSRDEYVGVGKTAIPFKVEIGTGAYTRSSRAHTRACRAWPFVPSSLEHTIRKPRS